MSSPALLRPHWPAPAAVRAGFTLRAGGVSTPPFDSFNLAAHSGDSGAAVDANRRLLRQALSLPGEPLWLAQVHGTRVIDADQWRAATAPEADAAFTRQPGTVLAVLVADCLPVLLARADGSAVAVAHAGWRGLSAGVLEQTVQALGAAADTLTVWLGPAIGPAHFEVGAEVREAFCGPDPACAAAFGLNARGRWQCDLPQLARRRLAQLGVRCVYGTARCTFSDREAFYSYRRDGVTGRMAALAWLQP